MDELTYLVTYDEGESIENYVELVDAYRRFDDLKRAKVSNELQGWDNEHLCYRVIDTYEAPLNAFEAPYKLVDKQGIDKTFETYEEAAKRIDSLMREGVASELHVWDWMKGKYKPLIIFNPVPMMRIG